MYFSPDASIDEYGRKKLVVSPRKNRGNKKASPSIFSKGPSGKIKPTGKGRRNEALNNLNEDFGNGNFYEDIPYMPNDDNALSPSNYARDYNNSFEHGDDYIEDFDGNYSDWEEFGDDDFSVSPPEYYDDEDVESVYE